MSYKKLILIILTLLVTILLVSSGYTDEEKTSPASSDNGRNSSGSNDSTSPIVTNLDGELNLPRFDTLSNGLINLIFNGLGNIGCQGEYRVNFDYVGPDLSGIDCTIGSDAPLADIYLYEGSPFVFYLDEDGDDENIDPDTVLEYSMYGCSELSEDCFVNLWRSSNETGLLDLSIGSSGAFLTRNNSLIMNRYLITSKNPGTNWVIFCLRLASYDGAQHENIMIGEVYDWNIPSDTNGLNTGSIAYADENILYQQGGEYNEDDSVECLDNDRRFGGSIYLGAYADAIQFDSQLYSGYIVSADSFVYPGSGFVVDDIYPVLTTAGFKVLPLCRFCSYVYNFVSIASFENNFIVEPGVTYDFYSAAATIYDGDSSDMRNALLEAKAFFESHDIHQIIKSADFDLDGVLNAADNCDYTYNPSQADNDWDGIGDFCDNCPEIANGDQRDVDQDELGDRCDPDMDGDGVINEEDNCPLLYNPEQIPDTDCNSCCWGLRGNVDGDASDIQDIGDLVYMIDYQFRDGSEPSCFEEADVNADGIIDVADLVCMVDHQFRNDFECIQPCVVK